jgi:hypothetical protein
MEDIKQDIFELQRLTDSTTRDSVKKILREQVKRLESELKALEVKQATEKPLIQPVETKKETTNSVFKTEAITNYSWLQDPDIVTLTNKHLH